MENKHIAFFVRKVLMTEKRGIVHKHSKLKIILEICNKRIGGNPNDDWALEVKGRITKCVDFAAAEARYQNLNHLKMRNYCLMTYF